MANAKTLEVAIFGHRKILRISRPVKFEKTGGCSCILRASEAKKKVFGLRNRRRQLFFQKFGRRQTFFSFFYRKIEEIKK